MGNYHAIKSPSGAARWSSCTASPSAQKGYPNTTNEHSRAGTMQHQLCAECLEQDTQPQSYLGKTFLFPQEEWGVDDGMNCDHSLVVTQEMVDACTSAVNYVRQLRDSLGATLLVEQRLPIGHITGEEGATGTGDVVLLTADTIIVADFKMGRSRVKAYDVAEQAVGDNPPRLQMNLQLALYALGALHEYELLGEFQHAKAIIIQPYLNAISEYGCTVEELQVLGEWLKARAEACETNPEFVPTADNCFYCKAKNDCVARTDVVLDTACEGFEDVVDARPKKIPGHPIGHLYSLIDMIRGWCDDVEAQVHADLKVGKTVRAPNGVPYKLVAGKKGARKWDDAAKVEEMMASWNLPGGAMWKKTLISPTDVDKLVKPQANGEKPVIGKIRYTRLLPHIQQPDGKPQVVPDTDPRPALQPQLAGFDDVPPADNSDLLS